ncbi:MAG: hypothetical protein J7J97_02710 [Thermococcus sp.]|nr:hypothetical protein [Thermococcus sp.]
MDEDVEKVLVELGVYDLVAHIHHSGSLRGSRLVLFPKKEAYPELKSKVGEISKALNAHVSVVNPALLEDARVKDAIDFLLYSGLCFNPQRFDFDELEIELFDFAEVYGEDMMPSSDVAEEIYEGLRNVKDEELAESLGVPVKNIKRAKKLLRDYLASYGIVY